MNNGRCLRCGKSLAGRDGRARYCSSRCKRNATARAVKASDTDVIAERRKLENAAYACCRCACEHPLGLVDEDGEVRCFKGAWPLATGAAPPPSDFPAAA